MKSIAQRVNSLLNSNSDLQNLIGGQQAWELEDEEASLPFVTFSITENSPRSKDLPADYDVRVHSYGNSLEEASDVDGFVKTAMYQGRRVKSIRAASGYTDEESRKAVIIRTFNIKN
ncbi:hypothetical protein ACOKFD_15650 [Flagellimonas sp. S174]|uniref:hypothetical protein n=1 Tax=Flagellimonas sp. S174 TaxID=3410790 RepID=UPI003BF53A63